MLIIGQWQCTPNQLITWKVIEHHVRCRSSTCRPSKFQNELKSKEKTRLYVLLWGYSTISTQLWALTGSAQLVIQLHSTAIRRAFRTWDSNCFKILPGKRVIVASFPVSKFIVSLSILERGAQTVQIIYLTRGLAYELYLFGTSNYYDDTPGSNVILMHPTNVKNINSFERFRTSHHRQSGVCAPGKPLKSWKVLLRGWP